MFTMIKHECIDFFMTKFWGSYPHKKTHETLWKSQFRFDGKQIYNGLFKSQEEARQVSHRVYKEITGKTYIEGSPPFIRSIEKEEHTLEYFRKIMRYDKNSGNFYWKVKMSAPTEIGDLLGNVSQTGYRRVIIDSKQYNVHRLVWFFENEGVWPSHDLDHIDGNKLNNKIGNLRLVTPFLNQQNRPVHRKGILWGTSKLNPENHGGHTYYQSRVYGKYLGNFDTMEEAHKCSMDYAKKMNLPLIKELKDTLLTKKGNT